MLRSFKINPVFYSRYEATVRDLEVAFDKPASDKIDPSDSSDRYLETGFIPLLRSESSVETPSLSGLVERALRSSVLMIAAHYKNPFSIDEENLEDFHGHVKDCLSWQCVLMEVHQLSDLQVAVLFSRYQEELKPVWDKTVDQLDLPCTLPNIGYSFRLIATVDPGTYPTDGVAEVTPEVSVSFDLAGWSGKFEIEISILRDILKDYVYEAVESSLFVDSAQV